MTTQRSTVKAPTLREASIMFQSWRNNKKFLCEPVPNNLWDVATDLAKILGISKVSSTLHLTHSALKKHMPIRVEPTVQMNTLKAWELTCRRTDGTILSLVGTGVLPNVNNTVSAFLA